MSLQILDPFIWNDEKWEFLNTEDIYTLFDPKKYGLKPSPLMTTCWKGFVIQFSVKKDMLFLDRLDVHCQDGVYPDINGISVNNPEPDDGFSFHSYENIFQRLYYSGTITIGQQRMAHYGWSALTGPHMYARVNELVFIDGVLESYSDTSGSYIGI